MNIYIVISVTNALDYIKELGKLIASFDNAYEMLHHHNQIENCLYSKNIKKMRNEQKSILF
jgi:hypothetical protein